MAPPEALLGLSWQPLEPSEALLAALGRPLGLLGGSWQGPVGPGWLLCGPGLVPERARGRRKREGPETYVFIV